MQDLINDLKLAMVQAGEEVIKEHDALFTPHVIDTKYKVDDTPVTELDLRIHELMQAFAHEHNLGYVGEEGNGPTNNPFVLYVDPLDGTGAFTRGMNTATIIATITHFCCDFGTPHASIIYEPLNGRMWCGTKDGESIYEGVIDCPAQPVRCKHANGKIKTTICVWPGVSHNLAEVSARVNADRRFDDQQMGAVGITGGLIASGLIHASVLGATAATEAAAMMLIVNGAGGVSLDLEGNPLQAFKFGDVRGKADFELPRGALFAANQEIADTILGIIREVNAR